jgi:hypothetical protein
MAKGYPEKSFPAWLKILIPALAVFSLIIFVILMVLFKELPACATPEAIQSRFAKQVALLHEMASKYSLDEADVALENPAEDYEVLMAYVERQENWIDQYRDQFDIFDDPAILGARVITIYDENSTSSISLKHFEQPVGSLPLSIGSPGIDRPFARLWYAQGRHIVKYENRILDAGGQVRGYMLILDLDRLEAE